MNELKEALGELYEQFGHNEVTVKLSQILDELITKEQKERLECLNKKSDKQ